ncbi:MAG TPA: hypothetical protein VF736_10670 [Pyrinomonadaceae bacterium]|jgi:hypothetical protein
MIRASNIRLPGVYFLPSRRAPGTGLPPLDVAAFVGYAERGPLDWPVAVEDLDAYRAVFGGDMAVAREAGGRTVYANLPSAVASFFAQGGRRCHVVRVAGRKSSRTLFRLGGLVALAGKYDALSTEPDPAPACVYASSEGRWSESLRLGARLRPTPLPMRLSSASPPEEVFRVLAPLTEGGVTRERLQWATGSAPDAIGRGDLLRLSFADGGQYLFPVEEVRRPAEPAPPGATQRVELLSRYAWQVAQPAALPLVVRVDRLTPAGAERLYVTGKFSAAGGETAAPSFLFKMAGPDAPKVAAGDLLRVKRIDNVSLLISVSEVGVSKESGGGAQYFARAPQGLQLPAAQLPQTSPPTLAGVERLRFDLLLRAGKERRPTVEELSFNEGHARFWGDVVLTESSQMRRPVEGGEPTAAAGSRPPAPQGSQATAAAAASADLFREIRGGGRVEPSRLARLDPAALAGLLSPVEGDGLTFLPVGMLSVLGEEDILGPLEDDLGGDDLGEYDPTLFVDQALVRDLDDQPPTGDSLAAEAFDRYYVQDLRLKGLHGLLFAGEVALVALPEAVQRDWPAPAPPPEPEPPPAPPPAPPDLSDFRCCGAMQVASPPVAPTAAAPPAKKKAPELPLLKELDANDEADAQYISELGRLASLHHALLNFCQARRDAFAVLALPAFYEKRHCVRWQEEFRQRLGLPRRRSVFTDARDTADLSYAAVYHPWLLLADAAAADGLRAVPPDGAACGLIAARERERQVWVAPANTPLVGVLGLAPEVSTEDWADLFEQQFNFLRREARDFRAMSAHTLADEAIWLQVSVRRLLILVRKFVVERGMDFVFETNHERFRRGVHLVLEDALLFMHGLGAFAGAGPEQSFNVTTDASVNPPQSVDAGRFVAQIQVAPSQPAEFITVLLTRVAEDLLQAREG